MAERVGLTRAILALALRAHCVRPKSLLRFCRTGGAVHTPCSTEIKRDPQRIPFYFSNGGEGGIDSGHPGPRPAGALRASKIAPAILSNRWGRPHTLLHRNKKGSAEDPFLFQQWRRGWD